MKRLLLIGLCLLPAAAARAQSKIAGDFWTMYPVIVGTTTIGGARMRVLAGATTVLPMELSDVAGEPILYCDGAGHAGIGVSPSAGMDVLGPADSGAIGLQLRNGNAYPATSNYQLGLGFNGTANLRHAIRSEHSSSAANNSLDFLLWSPSISTTAIANLTVLSLVTTTTSTFVHVLPAGTPDVELEISDGATTGGGTLLRAAEGTHSSRALKSDITYLDSTAEDKAAGDIKNLRPAEYRYKVMRKGRLVRDKKSPLRRGLIYEEAPSSIQGSGKALILDERVTNAELATKAILRRLDRLDLELKKVAP